MDDVDEALKIMRGWSWEGCYRDFAGNFQWGPMPLPLADAVNRLAFEGHPSASQAMLSLIASGKVLAKGSFRWRGFRNGHHRYEGTGDIRARHWRALQEGLAGCLSPARHVSLFLVGDGDDVEGIETARAEWAWDENRFSTAQAGDAAQLFTEEYCEELFSAWNIEVRLAPAENDNAAPASSEPPAIERNKGGAPAKYDWERAVADVVFGWADEGSWQPTSQAKVKERLAAWFAARDQHPSDSLLKERARWLFAEFQRRASGADNLAA